MSPSDAPGAAQPLFLTTRWSVVLAAQDHASPASAEALEVHLPCLLVSALRIGPAAGHSPHDAQDLTQEFFAREIVREYFPDDSV